MKNRLSNFVNRINEAVDSVTKALENTGSGNNKQSNNGSIIDRLPVGENKKFQHATPTKQKVLINSAPTVAETPKKPERLVQVEPVAYCMYVRIVGRYSRSKEMTKRVLPLRRCSP